MNMRVWKAIWWFALNTGIGSFLFVVTVYLMRRDIALPLCVWSASGAVSLAVISVLVLRRSYRKESGPNFADWHLSISDLIGGSILSGLLMFALQRFDRETFLVIGLPFSLLSGLHFIVGILIARRNGMLTRTLKYSHATGVVLRNYGMMGIGILVFLMVVAIVEGGGARGCFEVCCTMFCFAWTPFSDYWFVYPTQLGIFFLPAGIVLCWWTKRRARTAGLRP